jgi:hypothetical protein
VTDEILLRFLRAGLIDVGGDDAKLGRLRETAADMAAAVRKTPSKAAAFSLIAFDPEAPAEDPVIRESVLALQQRWATYINTFSGTPIGVLRAILLDALSQAANADDNVGVAFVTSARNVLPFMEVGAESAIWADIVSEVERRIDSRAEREWATPSSIAIPQLTFDPPTPINIQTTFGQIDKAALAKSILAATGPQNPQNQPTNGNPHWPNSPQPWAGEFSTRMSDVLTSTLVEAGKKSAAPVDLAVPLDALQKAVSSYVEGTMRAVSGATSGLQRRTNLIWWKEALFSPTEGVSYRELPSTIASAAMAFDLHRQVPTFSPASVAAFLYESVVSLPMLDAKQEHLIRDLIKELKGTSKLGGLKKAAMEIFPRTNGRGPMLALVGEADSEAIADDSKFRDRFGVPADAKLTLPQWATWLFRELQAARAVREEVQSQSPGTKE